MVAGFVNKARKAVCGRLTVVRFQLVHICVRTYEYICTNTRALELAMTKLVPR